MIPFVRAWPTQRDRLAQERSKSLLFWYRQEYKIPLNDPRLDDITDMDLEVEYLAWVAFHQVQPSADQDDGRTDAWLEAVGRGEYSDAPGELERFVAQWEAQHENQAADDEGWDVIAGGGMR